MADPMKVIAVCAAVVCGSTAFSRVVNDGTQTRTSASERVPLVSLVMPALQQIGGSSRVAAGCFELLSNPTVKINRAAEIAKNGRAVNAELNEVLSSNAGKIIGCSAAISSKADEISRALRQKRPDRAQAIEIVKASLQKSITDDYGNFQNSNQDAYEVPVMVAKDNNGHSREYVAYNDVTIEVERPGEGQSMAADLKYKAIIDGGENAVKEKVGTIREIITDGVYSFFTNATTVNSLCARKGGKVEPCKDTYSVKFDGSALDVRKNGQRWFDAEFIGGAIYAIELSGEKSTSTTKKVDR